MTGISIQGTTRSGSKADAIVRRGELSGTEGGADADGIDLGAHGVLHVGRHEEIGSGGIFL
jgi:hypothetical protein